MIICIAGELLYLVKVFKGQKELGANKIVNAVVTVVNSGFLAAVSVISCHILSKQRSQYRRIDDMVNYESVRLPIFFRNPNIDEKSNVSAEKNQIKSTNLLEKDLEKVQGVGGWN